MSRFFQIKTFALLLIALISVLPASGWSGDALPSNWKIHSSFNNQPRKILDTPNAVYFLVHQHLYQGGSGKNGFQGLSGALFVYDKKNPAAGIVDGQKAYSMHGINIWGMAYNPAGDYLLVAYSDGGIDVIDNKGGVHYIDALRNVDVPGAGIINEITFDLGSSDATVGTAAGYLKISGNGYEPVGFASWGRNVNSICKVGKSTIAIISNKLYETESADILNYSAYSPIESIEAASPVKLKPLGDNYFMFLDGNAVKLAERGAAGWTVSTLFADNAILETVTANIGANNSERTFAPVKDGVLISAPTKSRLVKYSTPEIAKPSVVETVHPESSAYVGSWDNQTFWYYKDYGKFAAKTKEGTGWKDSVEPLRPEAPLTCLAIEFAYSPTQGLLAMNQGCDERHRFWWGEYTPQLLCSYKDGKWNNLSYRYNPPQLIKDLTAQSIIDIYNQKIAKFPTGDPMGFAVDPLNSDIVHYGSVFDAFTTSDLSDLSKYPVMYLKGNNPLLYLGPSIQDYFPVNTNALHVSVIGSDTEGTLWAWISRMWAADASMQTGVTLMYATAADRKKAFESGELDDYKYWNVLHLPANITQQHYGRGLVLNHPCNKNKVVVFPGGDSNKLAIVDHKGTLNDTSDDEVIVINEYVTPAGNAIATGFISEIAEDPVTGDLIACGADMYQIDLSKVSKNGKAYFTMPKVAGLDLSPLIVYSVCFDEYNRMWLGTTNGGIYGISADRKSVVAHYSVDNSPLPEGSIWDLGWNQETKSLFISSEHGILEVVPEIDCQVGSKNTFGEMSVTPTYVNPEYTGMVAVHNAKPGQTLIVKNSNGEVVAQLPIVKDGATHWDLLDADTKPVATGRYFISEPASENQPMEIVVVR